VGEPYTLALSGLEIDATGIGNFVTGEIGKMPSTELAWYALLSQENLESSGENFNERAFLELKEQGRETNSVIDILRLGGEIGESRWPTSPCACAPSTSTAAWAPAIALS
jgi:hypothetical protein